HRLAGEDDEAVAALVARLTTEPLELPHPWWQLHVLTGLDGGRFAVLIKLHHAVADGLRAVELGVGLLDGYADRVPAAPDPVDRSLLGTAWSVARTAVCPYRLLGRAASTAARLPGAVRDVADVAAIAGSVLSSARRAAARSPPTAAAPAVRPAQRRPPLRHRHHQRAGTGPAAHARRRGPGRGVPHRPARPRAGPRRRAVRAPRDRPHRAARRRARGTRPGPARAGDPDRPGEPAALTFAGTIAPWQIGRTSRSACSGRWRSAPATGLS